MKTTNTITCIALAAFLSCGVQAANYSFTVGNAATWTGDQAVVDSAGGLVATNSIVSFGYFSSLDDVTIASATVGDLATLDDDFVALGLGDWDVNGDGTTRGLFTATDDRVETDPVYVAGIGKSMYVFFGDGTALSSSASIGLVDSGVDIVSSIGAPSPVSENVDWTGGNFASGGSVILGSITTDNVAGIYTPVPAATSTGTFQLAAVPEPSSLALLGLGATALLFRRRK